MAFPQQDMMQLREQLMQQLGYSENPTQKRAREMSHALREQTPGMPAYAEQARQTLGEDIADVWNTPIPGSKTAMEGYNAVMEEMPWTPATVMPKLAGKVFPYLLIGLLDVILFVVIGKVAYSVPFRGRVADLLLFSSLFLLANLGISLLISSLVRTQMAALIIAGFVLTLPVINQSGLFHPLYAMSPKARLQALLWPATHYVIITRGIFLKGVGTQVLMLNGLFLLAIGLLLNGLAVWRLRKKLV